VEKVAMRDGERAAARGAQQEPAPSSEECGDGNGEAVRAERAGGIRDQPAERRAPRRGDGGGGGGA